jgi:FkbM family methyltransferase
MFKRLLKKILVKIGNNLFPGVVSLKRNQGYVSACIRAILCYLEDQLYSAENDFSHVSFLVREVEGYIDRKAPALILELGSRDAQVAILFKRYFPNASVYAFECNPPAIELCRHNIAISGLKDVILIEKAVSDEQGEVDFYAVDKRRMENIGASSLYPASPSNPEGTLNAQQRIKVDAVTLKQWTDENNVKAIDLLWMDLQGAELKALKGLGELIRQVRFIYTEVEYQELYSGQALFPQVDRYLAEHDFRIHRQMYIRNRCYGNLLYVNNAL